MKESSPGRTILAISILGGLLLRVVVAWAPIEWLLRSALPDDAFYYFTIARNIGEGHGVTFDRLAPTNGFHPLWQFLIVPIFGSVGDLDLGVRIALTLCALIETISILLLFQILGRAGINGAARAAVVLLFAFSPIVLSRAGGMNGLETSINTLLLLNFFARYLAARDAVVISTGESLLFGLVTGLLFLARTDNAIIIAVFYASLLLRIGFTSRVVRSLALSSLTATLAVVPWLLWNHATFGSIVQVSGESIGFFARTYFASLGWGPLEYALQTGRNLLSMVHFFPIAYAVSWDNVLGTVVTGAGLAAVLLFGILKRWLPELRSSLSPRRDILVTIGIAFLLFFLVHTLRAVLPRVWYYSTFIPFALIVLGYILDPLIGLFRRDGGAGWAVIVVVLFIHVIAYREAITQRGRDPDKYRMVEWARLAVPAGSRIGAWNAGVYGYFLPRHQVVNLDCVVNNIAYPYFRGRRLAAYCDSVHVSWLIDDLGTMRALTSYWGEGDSTIDGGLRIRHRIPISETADTVVAGERLLEKSYVPR